MLIVPLAEIAILSLITVIKAKFEKMYNIVSNQSNYTRIGRQWYAVLYKAQKIYKNHQTWLKKAILVKGMINTQVFILVGACSSSGICSYARIWLEFKSLNFSVYFNGALLLTAHSKINVRGRIK